MELNILGPFIILFVLYAMNMPVAYAMLVAGFVGIAWNSSFDAALGLLQTSPHRHSASFLLTTIPMFILMAEFLSRGRLTSDLFRAASAWLGQIRGGLAMSTVFANAGLAALSGSSTAAAASMGRVTIPEMRKYGYDERLSLGTVAAAGTFASMIPPSVGLIIYGVMTETPIGSLFIAGVIPGAITVIGYLILIYVCSRHPPDCTKGRTHYHARAIEVFSEGLASDLVSSDINRRHLYRSDDRNRGRGNRCFLRFVAKHHFGRPSSKGRGNRH